MTAARESAFEKDEQTANDPGPIAAELIGMANELGGTDDPALLALTAEAETDRIIGLAAHPSKSGVAVTTKTRAHASDLDEDPTDEDAEAKGGDVHAKIRRIIEENPDLFSDGKGRDASAQKAWPSPGPLSPQQREAGERKSLAGGRPGGRSIPELARGSAQVLSGR